jgi:hypothetical protein
VEILNGFCSWRQGVVRQKVYLTGRHLTLHQNRGSSNANIRSGQEVHCAEAQALHEDLQGLRG